MDPDGPRSRQSRLEGDGVLAVWDLARVGDAAGRGEALGAVAIAVGLDDGGAAVLLFLTQQAGFVGKFAVLLRDAVEGHEQVVVVFAPDANDVANNRGVRVDVGGMVEEGRDGVQVGRGVDFGGGFVHNFDRCSRGGAGILRVHGDDNDSVDASSAEVFHDGVYVGLTVLHADSDVILLAEQGAELFGKVLRMKEERGAAFVVPDGGVGLRGLCRALGQNEEVEDEPFEEGVEVDDARIA